MGCDIHIYTEIKKDGKWTYTGPIFENDYYHPDLEWSKPETDQVYLGRNYDLFAMLAGVRNYGDLEPISSPKGIPEDVSEEVQNFSDSWGVDGHSHSHLTLRELKQYRWHEPTIKSAMVHKDVAQRYKTTGEIPDSYCVKTNSPDYVHLTWAERMEELASDFYTKSIPELEALADDDPDSVRIVFWFDN